jgi:uncharacterized protein (DUF486 family)
MTLFQRRLSRLKQDLLSKLIIQLLACTAAGAGQPHRRHPVQPVQLKMMREAITLTVFVPFAMFYVNQPFKLEYVWTALCLIGAVYFTFRS